MTRKTAAGQAVTPPTVIFTPPAPRIALRDSPRGPAWAVCKPGTWRACTGLIEITPERLSQLATAYDPVNLDRAPFNFDHLWGGPALGWVAETFVDDGYLWVVPTELAAELVEEIQQKRRERFSIEIDHDYEPLGDWYLQGVAVLGASPPAVKGLPKPRLSASGDRYVIQLTDTPGAPAPPTDPPDPDPEKETEMKPDEQKATPAAGDPPAPDPNPATPPAPDPPPSAAEPPTTAQLAADRKALADERAAARRERLAARRERIEARVDRALEDLAAAHRVTPAQLRAGLKPALIELAMDAADEQPRTIQLAVKNQDGTEAKVERTPYDVVLAALAAAPEFTAAAVGELAGPEAGEGPYARDRRSAEQKRVDARLGITDEEAIRLQAKYRDGFGQPGAGDVN